MKNDTDKLVLQEHVTTILNLLSCAILEFCQKLIRKEILCSLITEYIYKMENSQVKTIEFVSVSKMEKTLDVMRKWEWVSNPYLSDDIFLRSKGQLYKIKWCIKGRELDEWSYYKDRVKNVQKSLKIKWSIFRSGGMKTTLSKWMYRWYQDRQNSKWIAMTKNHIGLHRFCMSILHSEVMGKCKLEILFAYDNILN